MDSQHLLQPVYCMTDLWVGVNVLKVKCPGWGRGMSAYLVAADSKFNRS